MAVVNKAGMAGLAVAVKFAELAITWTNMILVPITTPSSRPCGQNDASPSMQRRVLL